MSWYQCKYCGQIAFKTNGNAENICESRAGTGFCAQSGISHFEDYNVPKQQIKKAANRICIHNKKIKNCKHCKP